MQLQRFAGKVALCTGATQGIGLAVARRLAQEGCRVVVNSRRQENVEEAVEGLRRDGFEVSGVVGNSRIKEDRRSVIKYACEKYGGIDSVFLSAGVSPRSGHVMTVNEEQFDRAFDTNVKANFQFIQELAPVLERRPGTPAIVTNATAVVYGLLAAVMTEVVPLYVLSKSCLVALTQNFARELVNKNIRINCIAPGPVATNFLKGGVDEATFGRYHQSAGMRLEDPSARMGTPEEIGSAVAFLLSDDASFITGTCVIASGGYGLNRSL